MEKVAQTDGAFPKELSTIPLDQTAPTTGTLTSPAIQQRSVQPLQKTKRRHRRGKPKPKNVNKPYKEFQSPRYNYNYNVGGGGGGNSRARAKLMRSRSLVPYNTNKFLMEEHLAEIPSTLLTPSGRTRDSSFSVDSEDNYFFSLPEDEEEFLTKEFANVYEKARVERLENLTKQQLIDECLQIEDRYSTDQGAQRQQQLNVQRISAEFITKIRVLEENIKELSRENYNLRCQLMRSAALAAAAAASPPSAAAPIGAACEPIIIDSSSEDSESDSSSTSSSSSSSANGNGHNNPNHSCSSRSSISESEYNGHVENNCKAPSVENDIDEEGGGHEQEEVLDSSMESNVDNEMEPLFQNIETDADKEITENTTVPSRLSEVVPRPAAEEGGVEGGDARPTTVPIYN